MLDLNEIRRDHETTMTWWNQLERREATAKLLAQLPALVAELTQAREELTAVDESLGKFHAPVLDPETEEPCGSFWKDHGVNVMRQKLEHVQAERDTLSALVPLYRAVDDYLYHAAGNNYPTGYHNPDRLAVLRKVFLGMSADSPELEGLETQPAYRELERAQAEIERLRAFVPSPELMQRLAALDEDYAKRVDEAYEANTDDRA